MSLEGEVEQAAVIILLIILACFILRILELFFGTSEYEIYQNFQSFPGPWDHTTLVLGPNENLANGRGPKGYGPWSLGSFGQMTLVPGPPFRASRVLALCHFSFKFLGKQIR